MLAAALAPRAGAQTVWTGTTGNWGTAGNWSAGVPGAATDAVIANSGTATLTANGSAQNLTVGQAAAGALTITSGTLSLSGAAFIGTSTGDGTVTVSGGTLATAGDLITGYFRAGTVTASGGTLSISGTSYVGYGSTSTATVSGGSWTTAGDLYVGIDAGLGGAGTLTISGGTVSAGNVYAAVDLAASGTINLNGGVLAAAAVVESSGSGGGRLNFNGGTLRATGTNAAFVSGFESGDIQLASGGGTIDSNGFNIGIANVIQGAGALTKSGTGTLTLSGASTYTGATNVNAGTLNLANGNNVVSSSLLTVNTGGTLTAPNLRIGAAGAGTEALAVSGGAVTITGESYIGHTYAGSATLSGGTWSTGGALYVGVGGGTGALSITGGSLSTGASAIAGAGLDTGTGSATISGGAWNSTGSLTVGYSGTGQLTVDGGTVTAGNVRLSKDPSGAGTLNLNAGVVATGALVRGNGTAQFNFNGGTLRATANNADFTTGFSAGDFQIARGGATLDTQSYTVVMSAAMQGMGGLVKSGAGTLTLSGASTYSGATNVAAGTLRVTGSIADSAVSVASGATLAGNGTVGDLTILSGGIIAPGNSPGTLSAGDTTFAGGGRYVWEINSVAGTAGASTGWDLLNISGTLNVTATSGNRFQLDLASLTAGNAAGNVPDFTPASFYSFVFASASDGITGFSADKFDILTDNFSNSFTETWSVTSDGFNLSLNYGLAPVPEPSTYALLFGLTALGGALWRRRLSAKAP
ncbi:MAG: hypothetical protein C0502_01535 [Opitutus sp.]|nr:hypothetical protein [Opitutus sp.]